MEVDTDTELGLEAAMTALRSSPLVKSVGFNDSAKKGVYARLWCARREHPKRDSEQLNITRERKSLTACAVELLELINKKHGAHLAAAEAERAAAAAEEATAAGPSAPTTAFAAMAAAAGKTREEELEVVLMEDQAKLDIAEQLTEAQTKSVAKTVKL